MKYTFHSYWRSMANGTASGVVYRMLSVFFIPMSLLYQLIQSVRASLYKLGILKTYHLPKPVISVGNITVGGTGKTPACLYLARYLISHGYKVALISRGYGGEREGGIDVVSNGEKIFMTSQECGDEPYLLAKKIPGLIVILGSDRYGAGLFAMEQFKPDVFLLDDGFQHLRLFRNLNILLLDAKNPAGNGWTLPAGLLRESLNAIRRADIIFHTRSPEDVQYLESYGKPFCRARHEIVSLALLENTDSDIDFSQFEGKKILAFAGIASPEGFFDSLKKKGLQLQHAICFPDHAKYEQSLIREIQEGMGRNNCELCVTTEKDSVKLHKLPEDLAGKIFVAKLELVLNNPIPIEKLVEGLFKTP